MNLVSKIISVMSLNSFITLYMVKTSSGGRHFGFSSKWPTRKQGFFFSKKSYLSFFLEYSYDLGV